MRGECPGDHFKTFIRKQLGDTIVTSDNSVETSAIEKLPKNKKVSSKVNEALKTSAQDMSKVQTINLSRGTAFPDQINYSMGLSQSVPTNGYFEFVNKGKDICCVKLLAFSSISRDDYKTRQRFEIPRPSYLAVLPGGIVHANFESTSSLASLELIVLHR